MSDRTVHAVVQGMEVVRYDRAGRWYGESLATTQRGALTLTQAVAPAKQPGARVLLGLPGGGAFDARMRR